MIVSRTASNSDERNSGADCAPAVASARGPVDHGAELARSAFCALARCERAVLRPHIPATAAASTHLTGQAWLGVVPFRMSGVRLRGTPAVPWLSAFPELNVRTYVVAGGKPGVWFFSLDAANKHCRCDRACVVSSCLIFARECRAKNEMDGSSISAHVHIVARLAECLNGRYRATGEVFSAASGSLDHFLTERYCLYTVDGEGRIISR